MLASFSHPAFDPVAFHIGPYGVRWYGLAYLAGFMLSYLALLRMIHRGRLRITSDMLASLITWLAVGVMLGGRLGWWMFYHRGGVEAEPWYEPIAIWHGGMSFHGGLIGVSIALLLWCRVHRRPLWNVADCLALVVPVGLFLGRLANFINAELVGRPTWQPWGVVFPGEVIARHPSQLYEAVLEGPVLLACVWLAARRRPRLAESGIAARFLVLYGVFRFIVEFTREPDLQLGFVAFGWLTMGQVLSIGVVLGGAAVWLNSRVRNASPELTAILEDQPVVS